MRRFHCLTFDSTRDDLISVVDYEMNDFDLTVFWQGKPVTITIPPSVKLYCDCSKDRLADYVGNPISWPICSDRLVSLIKRMAVQDVVFREAPIFDRGSNQLVPGYQIMNVIRTVPCLDLQASKVSYSPDQSRVTGVSEFVLKDDLIPHDFHIFRLKEWTHSIIFSDELAQSFVGMDLKGVAFIRTGNSSDIEV